MRIIIAGGGTGGHVIPALAIAQQLKKQFDAEVLLRLLWAVGKPSHRFSWIESFRPVRCSHESGAHDLG